MASPINFIITSAGKNAMLNAEQNGVKLTLNKVGLGTAHYKANEAITALKSEFQQSGMSAGGVEIQSYSLRFTMIMATTQEYKVSEIGIYTDKGVLFAVASLEDGEFFTIYPSIDFVAPMGLYLDKTMDLSKISVILDGRGGISSKLMQDHVNAPDPHPQYKQFAQKLMQEHLAHEDPHPQYALKTFVDGELNKLQGKIDNLIAVTGLIFPPLIIMGGDSGNKITASKKLGAVYSYEDPSFIYLFCPEGQHEGWRTIRDSHQIVSEVFDRSGTERISYGKRANWIIIDTIRAMETYGFRKKTSQLAGELKMGVIEAGQALTILKGAGETADYLSDDTVLLLTPEGQHEGWTVTRKADRLDLQVYDRSGTNRTSYAGRINWALFTATKKALESEESPSLLISGTVKTEKFTIPAPAGKDFLDVNYVPMITPEGEHEGWTVTRKANAFDVQVFGRSGVNRASYSGRINWAVFQVTTPSKIYRAGTYTIIIPANSKAEIHLVGAGGSGGGSLWASDFIGEWKQMQSGADTTFKIGSELDLVAGGGTGGWRGSWNNGSAYRQGIAGEGGKPQIKTKGSAVIIEHEDGGKAYLETALDWCNRDTRGGDSSYLYGAGGEGGYTVETRKHRCYGAGGGSGAHIHFEYSNNTDQPIEATLVVGNFAPPDTITPELNNGKSGEAGCATVRFIELAK